MHLRLHASLRVLTTVTVLVAASILAMPASEASAESDQPNTLEYARAAAVYPTNTWLPGAISSAEDQDWFRFRLRAPGTVQVTLGDLPADYRLTLVSRDGRQLAASDRAETGYEQVQRAVAAGEYFVEVGSSRGDAEPQRNYRLLLRRLADRVTVLDSHPVHRDGLLIVTGQLLNNTRSWRQYPRVTAEFLGADGKPLGRSTALAEQTYLSPGQRGYFRIVADAPTGMVRYVLTVRATRTKPPARAALALQPDQPYPVGAGRTRYVGRVTHPGAGAVEHVNVHVLRYNRIGAFVDFGHAVLPQVAAGEPGRYEIELPTYGYVNGVQLSYSLG